MLTLLRPEGDFGLRLSELKLDLIGLRDIICLVLLLQLGMPLGASYLDGGRLLNQRRARYIANHAPITIKGVQLHVGRRCARVCSRGTRSFRTG